GPGQAVVVQRRVGDTIGPYRCRPFHRIRGRVCRLPLNPTPPSRACAAARLSSPLQGGGRAAAVDCGSGGGLWRPPFFACVIDSFGRGGSETRPYSTCQLALPIAW